MLITLAQALKEKNRLVGEISKLWLLVQHQNACWENRTRSIDVNKTMQTINEYTQKLIELKTKIGRANDGNLANIYAGILTGMSDARVSVVSNNLAVIMKYLAIINVVFLPLMVITSLGGMSEFTMMTSGIWWPHAYSALALVLVILGYVTYLLVRRIGSSRR